MFKRVLILAVLVQFYSCDVINSALGSAAGSTAGLSITEIVNGLKEALKQGTNKGTANLSQRDGFFKNLAVKILFPAEAQNVANKLQQIGMGNLVDQAVEKINRAAEDAAVQAGPIFVNAITSMTIADARNILMGADNAATSYLKRTTSTALYNAFKPIIKTSLNKVGALDAWNLVISNYNKIPLVQKVNPNLDDHVTNKAIDGVFHMIEKEEKEIRVNPVARGTALLRKVFAEQDRK
jgi:hypothetical protein